MPAPPVARTRSPPVSRILFRQAVVIISLGPALPVTSVRCCSLGRAGPRARGAACERSCFGWGLPRDHVTVDRRELLPHDFTIAELPRLYVSVALSFESPRQDVILHPAQ